MSAQPALRAPSSPWRSTYEKAQRAAEKRQVAADEGAADEGAGTGGGGGGSRHKQAAAQNLGPGGREGRHPTRLSTRFCVSRLSPGMAPKIKPDLRASPKT
jgi:hypothetical protein